MTPEPLPSLAALLAEADRVEHDAFALSRSFPRAVGRTLHLAARAGAVNRRAVSLNTELARAGVARRVGPVASAVPLAVAEPMFRAMLDAEPVEAERTAVDPDVPDVPQAVPGPPHARHEAVGIEVGQAGGADAVPGLGPPGPSPVLRA